MGEMKIMKWAGTTDDDGRRWLFNAVNFVWKKLKRRYLSTLKVESITYPSGKPNSFPITVLCTAVNHTIGRALHLSSGCFHWLLHLALTCLCTFATPTCWSSASSWRTWTTQYSTSSSLHIHSSPVHRADENSDFKKIWKILRSD